MRLRRWSTATSRTSKRILGFWSDMALCGSPKSRMANARSKCRRYSLRRSPSRSRFERESPQTRTGRYQALFAPLTEERFARELVISRCGIQQEQEIAKWNSHRAAVPGASRAVEEDLLLSDSCSYSGLFTQ